MRGCYISNDILSMQILLQTITTATGCFRIPLVVASARDDARVTKEERETRLRGHTEKKAPPFIYRRGITLSRLFYVDRSNYITRISWMMDRSCVSPFYHELSTFSLVRLFTQTSILHRILHENRNLDKFD